jgi:hypothetical protein
MNNSENGSFLLHTLHTNATANATTPPCGIFNPEACAPGEMSQEDRFLAIVTLALACAVCVLCLVVFVLAVLIQKLSQLWLHSLLNPSERDNTGAKTGLLHKIRSSRTPSSTTSTTSAKKKMARFADDTSCAPARDVDEEDL